MKTTERREVEPPTSSPRRGVARWELIAVAIIVASVAIFGSLMIVDGVPFGHDEAVYGQRARYFAGQGVTSGYWAPYRAPGLPALMSLGVRAADTDGGLRAVPLILACILLVLTWAWARYLLGPLGGIIAAGLLAITPGYLLWAWQIGVDIPGAAHAFAAILIFTFASRGERVSRWGYLAIPLALGAAYTRFGAPVLVAAGMTVVAIGHWRAVRASLGRTALIAAGTAIGMWSVLYTPFMTGSSLAPARAFEARQVAKGLPFWQSYVDFAKLFPDLLGPIVGIAVVAGTALAATAWLTKRLPARSFVLPMAGFVIFMVGLNYGLAQGFIQYALPSLPFLMTAVAAGLALVAQRLPRAVSALAAGAILVAGLVTSFGWVGARADANERGFSVLQQASEQLGTMHPEGCIVITSYSPQVGWYSRCTAFTFPVYANSPKQPADGDEAKAILDRFYRSHAGVIGDKPVFVLLVERGKRQPDGVMLDYLVGASTELIRFNEPQDGRLQHVVVRQFPPRATSAPS